MIRKKRGSTGVKVWFLVDDTSSSTGAKLKGLTYASASLTACYTRDVDAAAVAIPLVAGTIGTWISGGFAEISQTLSPGLYQLSVPDSAWVLGNSVAITIQGAANMAPQTLEIDLVSVDDQDAVRMGMSSLPNIAQGNIGALPTGDATGKATLTSAEHANIATDTQTGLTAQGLTAALIALLPNLDAKVSSRSVFAGGAVASVVAPVEVGSYAAGCAPASSTTGSIDYNAVATSVWNSDARSLTSFGTLVADIWAFLSSNVSLVSGSIGKFLVDKLTSSNTAASAPTVQIDSQPGTASDGGITLALAQQMLTTWLQAETSVAVAGQSYIINLNGNKREMTRANLAEIQVQVKFWQRKVRDLNGVRRRVGFTR